METVVTQIHSLLYDEQHRTYLPHIEIYVRAGFPSPADDYLEKPLDLTEHLISHPSATYYIQVSGHSMINYGIFDGDLLIVDRSLEPRRGDIVIVALDGELTCKCLESKEGSFYLKSGNRHHPPIPIRTNDTIVWGIVIHNIHSFRKR